MTGESVTNTLFDVHDDFASGAEFSECRKYRYVLWRRWAWEGYANQVMFIGLNPSTADEREDDPTIRRCVRFAKDWGYSGILMMNAFAFRATQPADMKAASDPACINLRRSVRQTKWKTTNKTKLRDSPDNAEIVMPPPGDVAMV
jgi:hypothetical protein